MLRVKICIMRLIIKDIILGDEKMFFDGNVRGQNHGSIIKFSQKGLYRKHQRVTDAGL